MSAPTLYAGLRFPIALCATGTIVFPVLGGILNKAGWWSTVAQLAFFSTALCWIICLVVAFRVLRLEKRDELLRKKGPRGYLLGAGSFWLGLLALIALVSLDTLQKQISDSEGAGFLHAAGLTAFAAFLASTVVYLLVAGSVFTGPPRTVDFPSFGDQRRLEYVWIMLIWILIFVDWFPLSWSNVLSIVIAGCVATVIATLVARVVRRQVPLSATAAPLLWMRFQDLLLLAALMSGPALVELGYPKYGPIGVAALVVTAFVNLLFSVATAIRFGRQRRQMADRA